MYGIDQHHDIDHADDDIDTANDIDDAATRPGATGSGPSGLYGLRSAFRSSNSAVRFAPKACSTGRA